MSSVNGHNESGSTIWHYMLLIHKVYQQETEVQPEDNQGQK